MGGMTIGRLAGESGVGVETVRYYQRRGLLAVPERAPYGVRRYGDDDLRRLRFIRTAQAAGFTLDEIGELIDLDTREDRDRARQLADRRVAALDLKIAELGKARDALHRLSRDCAHAGDGPCPILLAFEG